MAGRNFLSRVLHYVANEHRLANSPSIQKFALRSATAVEDARSTSTQKVEQMKEKLINFLKGLKSEVNEELYYMNLGSQESRENDMNSYFEPKYARRSGWYFAAAGLVMLSLTSSSGHVVCLEKRDSEDLGGPSNTKKPRVVFVLGGPGSGKGTQCAKIVDTYGFTHLSAGDLLRDEIKSGSKDGTMIYNTIKEGKIVPSEVTVKLLQKAMNESGNDKFLIDGFPRNEENRASFEVVTGIEPDFVVFLDCTDEEMEKRLLNRNQGRVDDNIETIRKRFKVFIESSLPVMQQYELRGKLRKINASRDIEEVFKSLQPLFVPFIKLDRQTCFN